MSREKLHQKPSEIPQWKFGWMGTRLGRCHPFQSHCHVVSATERGDKLRRDSEHMHRVSSFERLGPYFGGQVPQMQTSVESVDFQLQLRSANRY